MKSAMVTLQQIVVTFKKVTIMTMHAWSAQLSSTQNGALHAAKRCTWPCRLVLHIRDMHGQCEERITGKLGYTIFN